MDSEMQTHSNGIAVGELPNGANGRPSKKRSILAPFFECIESELRQVESELQSSLASQHASVDRLLQTVRDMGGKRMRPALLLLCAKAAGEMRDSHITLSVVIEMIHAATLVHDDVLDGADQRRHLPTMNSVYGNEASVLCGDFLFSKAFYLASTLETTHACREIGNTTNIVCEGEMRQIGSCGNLDLTAEEYFEIIEAKTAVLCATAAYLGACFAGADESTCEKLREYGRLIGVAFQVIDDILDLQGSENEVGKSLGTDLEQQKTTLPLIHLYQNAAASRKASIREAFAAGDVATLGSAIRESGAIDAARATARELSESAKECLQSLDHSPAKQALVAIADYLITRGS